MKLLYIRLIFPLLLVALLHCISAEDEKARDEKLISTFQIVRFPNEACVGSNSRNGTCYTSAECSDKNGASSGSCADGFGVCCTFLITACGSSSSENVTYWTQPTAGITSGTAQTCGLTVCPVSDDICSLRLDFTAFVITGPNTLSTYQIRRTFGIPVGDLQDTTTVLHAAGFTTNCLYDTFEVQGASPSSAPPEVCGTLTGEHMYVEADMDRCNLLQFSFADYVQSTTGRVNTRGILTLSSRSWDITVTQIECTSATLPPVGCTQYFYGSGVASLQSHNYAGAIGTNGGIHLANQHQRVCIRRERGKCIGCFYTDANGLRVGGGALVEATYTYAGGCCGYLNQIQTGFYGTTTAEVAEMGVSEAAGALSVTPGFDCIIIPGAFFHTVDENENGVPIVAQTAAIIANTIAEDIYMTPGGPQMCGNGGGLGIGDEDWLEAAEEGPAATELTIANYNDQQISICTRSDPFVLEFLSDDQEGQGGNIINNEFANAAQAANLGFYMTHSQIDC
jgi:hypothetical protein